jgi:hypothetical protein
VAIKTTRDIEDIGAPVHQAERVRNTPAVSPWDIRTIARRLRHASDSMGVHVTYAFAERMATEGLRRAGEVGMAQASDTVIFFVASADSATTTILGWANDRSCLDRFKSLRLVPNLAGRASADVALTDGGGPEL